jgi:hypothetical protein
MGNSPSQENLKVQSQVQPIQNHHASPQKQFQQQPHSHSYTTASGNSNVSHHTDVLGTRTTSVKRQPNPTTATHTSVTHNVAHQKPKFAPTTSPQPIEIKVKISEAKHEHHSVPSSVPKHIKQPSATESLSKSYRSEEVRNHDFHFEDEVSVNFEELNFSIGIQTQEV